MYRSDRSLGPKRILIAVFMSLFVAGAQVKAQAEKDPHRPPCVDVYCKKIKSFVKKIIVVNLRSVMALTMAVTSGFQRS
jgi:hypothetical protein